MFDTHGHEVMHVPLTLLPKGPLSQCLQKAYRVDGLQLILVNSFFKLVAELQQLFGDHKAEAAPTFLRGERKDGFGDAQVWLVQTYLGG